MTESTINIVNQESKAKIKNLKYREWQMKI